MASLVPTQTAIGIFLGARAMYGHDRGWDRAGMNGHGGKVLRFENAHRNAVDRAGRVAENIHAPAVDRVVRLHRLDNMAQQERPVVAHAPPLPNGRVRPGQDDAFLLGQRLPVLDQDLSVATRAVQQDDERRRLVFGAVGHEQVVRAFSVLGRHGFFGDLLGVRARGERQNQQDWQERFRHAASSKKAGSTETRDVVRVKPKKNNPIQSANGIDTPVNGRGGVFCWTADRSSCKHRIPPMSFAAFVGTPALRGHLHRRRGWLAYVLAWVALALLWSVTAAGSSGMSPRVTLRFGFVIMTAAGALGVGVWWLTGRLPWDRRSLGFYATHACSAVVYALGYTSATLILELFEGRFSRGLASAWTSGILGWNILMGSWLYLIVAGLSYGIRTQQRLNEQAAAATEARMLAERAQLAALRARLNPHFLFNALHTVSSLVASDPAAADEAIERLGGLLRYALDESTEEIPLEREWAFTRDYLSFERLRLGNRLRVRETLDPDALASDVPLLVLQPLVENAVRHAIAPSPDGATIHVNRDRS